MGRMLTAHPNVEYIHEPFNPEYSTGRDYGLQVPSGWLHVHERIEVPYLEPVRRLLDLKPLFWSRLYEADGWRLRREIWSQHQRLRDLRRRKVRVLIKDPIGFFSAEWMARRFAARVVIVVRHPAAWVDSFLRTDWCQPRERLRTQPELCAGLLKPFYDVLHGEQEKGDRLQQTCTTWNMFMHVMRTYRESHPDWLFVRHEDLSVDPLAGFERLYRNLGLVYNEGCRDVVRRHSLADSKSASYARASVTRDSRLNLLRWRKNLTQESVKRIRELTSDFWPDFYSAEDWS